jgi:hypothetical protein
MYVIDDGGWRLQLLAVLERRLEGSPSLLYGGLRIVNESRIPIPKPIPIHTVFEVVHCITLVVVD